VLNRAVRREALFKTELEYEAFEVVLRQSLQHVSVELLAYCAMPNLEMVESLAPVQSVRRRVFE